MKDENSSGRTSGEGSFSPYDYVLKELKLINALGTNVDIDFLFREINIYEDLFSNVLSGDMIISDSTNLFNTLNMHGNEFISIAFSSPGMQKYQKIFRIYKVSDYSLRGTSNATFKIHFCSEEFLLNQQYYISKSFKETKLSDVVRIIANGFLKIPKEKLNDASIEETSLLLKTESNPLIVPNLKPFEAINWISSFALSRADLSPGFYFYENINGFNFKSLTTLCSSPYKKTITYAPKNNDPRESIGLKQDILDEMEYKQVFDVLDNINNGAYASELLKLDVLNRTAEYEQFGVDGATFKMLNKFLPYNLAKNRLGNSLNQASAYVRMFPKFQDNLTSKWLLVRAARLAMLNSTKLHVDLPGDSSMSVGDILNVRVPKPDAQTNEQNIVFDPLMSGNYLITGLRHKILDDKYYCHLQLCKDSVGTNLNYTPPFNSAWNLVINS